MPLKVPIKFLSNNGIKCTALSISDAIHALKQKKLDIVINTATVGYESGTPGFELRHTALAHDVIIFTCLNTADIYTSSVKIVQNNENIDYRSMEEYIK